MLGSNFLYRFPAACYNILCGDEVGTSACTGIANDDSLRLKLKRFVRFAPALGFATPINARAMHRALASQLPASNSDKQKIQQQAQGKQAQEGRLGASITGKAFNELVQAVMKVTAELKEERQAMPAVAEQTEKKDKKEVGTFFDRMLDKVKPAAHKGKEGDKAPHRGVKGRIKEVYFHFVLF